MLYCTHLEQQRASSDYDYNFLSAFSAFFQQIKHIKISSLATIQIVLISILLILASLFGTFFMTVQSKVGHLSSFQKGRPFYVNTFLSLNLFFRPCILINSSLFGLYKADQKIHQQIDVILHNFSWLPYNCFSSTSLCPLWLP